MITPKENDMLLNMLANPQFTVTDFQSVGLTGDNTNLLSEEEYKASEKITNNDFFKNDLGQFDEAKFHNFYTAATAWYNQLASQDYNQAILDQAIYSKDNIWAEPEKKKLDYAPKLVRSANLNLVSNSLESIGKKGARTKSISEIAQTQQIYDTKTGEWKDSPNDSFFDNFFETLVLATYDEDEFDEDGNLIHLKGEYKLNENGTYYYETLGGRDVYGKLVLNKMNILTTDGSTVNRFDFFDSDDLEQKSIGGTILKNAALVGSMFIPGGVGATIIGLNVLTQSAGILATVGKLFVGNNNEMLNNIQGWAKTVNRSTLTEYAAENTWCAENIFNMIGDTVGQLAEQRWIFKAAPALLGNTKAYKVMQKGGYDEIKAAELARLNKQTQTTVKDLLDDVLKTGKHPEKSGLDDYIAGMSLLNEKRAASYIDDILKESLDFSAALSRAYMTALVVQDTYGEAKAAGASDLEAALLTLGYAWGENKILKSDLGNWIMPELKGDKFKMRMIANALTKDVKEATEKYTQTKSKLGFIQSVLNTGKKIAEGHYALKALLGSKGIDVIGAHALGESFEEVSEELLADFSKSVFNVTRWLRGEDALDLGAFENIGDRYLMSALGGFVGGGINSAATDFGVSNRLRNMNKTQAMQELIYLVNNGKEGEFLRELDKMQLGDKNLSATEVIKSGDKLVYAEAKNGESQDAVMKTLLRNEIKWVKNILEAEGAKVSTESLLNKLTLEDLNTILLEFRYNKLKDTQAMGLFLQNYQNLQADLLDVHSQLFDLDKGSTDSKPDDSVDVEAKRKQLNQKLEETREKIKLYKEGNMVPEAIMDALFEMNPLISDFFTKTTLPFYAESKTGKKWELLSDNEKETMTKEYKEYSKTSMKNDIHTGAKLFRDMLELFTPFANLARDYITNLLKKDFKIVLNLLDFSEHVFGMMASIDPNSPGFDLDSVLGKIQEITNKYIDDKEQGVAGIFIPDDLRQRLNDINKKPIFGDYTEEVRAIEWKFELYNGILDLIDTLLKPFIELGHINPEIKNSLTKYLKDLTKKISLNTNMISTYVESLGLSFGEERQLKRLYLDKFLNDINIINLYISEIKKLTHTPILQYLDLFRLSVSKSDLNLSKHFLETETLLKDSSDDVGNFSVDGEWSETNDQALDLINAFIAVVNGMKTDNAGFNNPTGYTKILNNIFKQQGVKDYVELAEFDSLTADLILQDAQIIKNKLEYAKTLSAINTGLKLKLQDKVGVNQTYLLFNSFKRFINIIPDDWLGKDELKNVFDSLEELEKLSSEGNTRLNKEDREAIEKEMNQIEDGIYNFFNANRNANGGIDSEKLSILLKEFAGDNGFFNKTGSLLTDKSKNIDDNSFIWWLAARSAVKSSDFYNVYQKSLNEKIAPIPSQELATYLGVAAITNMNMLNSFVDAYRNTVIKEYNNITDENKRKKLLDDFDGSGFAYAKDLLKFFGGHNVLPLYRNMVFIEGAPGTGKSKGVFANIINIVKQIDPDYFKNKEDAWYVHATQPSADKANGEVGLNGTSFGRVEFLLKISNKWKDTKYNIKTVDKTTGRFLYDDSYEFNSEGLLVNTWELNKYSESELPKVIFIDEVTHYNQLELSMIEQFARENGIIVLTAGDLDQDTQVAYVKVDKRIIDVSFSRNNFIRSPKLGVSLRTLNKQMTQSLTTMLAAKERILNGKSATLDFNYLDKDPNHKGLYGVKTILVDGKYSSSDLDTIKENIKLMVDTATGPIGYIYHDENSELYKYITSNYDETKIIPFKDSDAQGLEGQYYIVENNRDFEGLTPTSHEQESYLRSLYTGVSRAEQGVLAIVPGSYGNITSIASKEDNKFLLESITDALKLKAYEVRKDQIDTLLEGLEPQPITIIRPSKISTTSSYTPPAPSPIPPVIPNPVPVVSTKNGYSSQAEAQEALDKLILNLETIGKIEDLKVTNNDTGKEYNIVKTEVISDVEGSTTFYYPMIELSEGIRLNISDLSEYTITNPTTNVIALLYNIGDEITIDESGNISNIRLVSVNNNGTDIEYEALNLDDNTIRIITQSDLQNVYKGPYVKNEPESKTLVAEDSPLENGTVETYELVITGGNISEGVDENKVKESGLIREIFTFNMFEMGVKNDNGKPVFDGDLSKFNARIDNAIGLLHNNKYKNSSYEELEKMIAFMHNLVNTETDNSVIASRMKQLLGLSGNVKIAFAIKSSAGRHDNSKYPIFDRYDMGDETLNHIHSDTPNSAIEAKRKKIVMIVEENSVPVFELSVGCLDSPLTTIQYADKDGNPLFPTELADFMAFRERYSNNDDGLYQAIKDLVDKYDGKTTNQDLIEAFEFWLFTSNGIFYFNDDFNLANNPTNGPELVKRKGDFQLDGDLLFTHKFIEIEELLKNPQFHASSIMMSRNGLINDKPVVKRGHSFILISDTNKYTSDDQLVNQYIAQLDPNYTGPKDVKLFYIIPPSGTISDWVTNLHNLYENAAGAAHEIFDIGNDFTPYRILSSLLESGQFDSFESSDGHSDEIKQALQQLKEIEVKWHSDNLTFTSPLQEFDYNELKENYDEKTARNLMMYIEQKALLNTIPSWNIAGVGILKDKPLSKYLSSYITNMVWFKAVQGVDYRPNVLTKLLSICANSSNPLEDIFYHPQYSKDDVGPFTKVLVSSNNKYELNSGVSGKKLAFRINAKIDTRSFLIEDLSSYIKEFNSYAYYDKNKQVYKLTDEGKDKFLKRYLRTTPNTQQRVTAKENIETEYKKYFDSGELNKSILTNSDNKIDLLIMLAEDYNTKPGNYGFVFNDKLILTKLENPSFNVINAPVQNIDVNGTKIKVKDLNGNEQERVIYVDVDNNGFINKVNCRCTEVKKVDITSEAKLELSEDEFNIFKQGFEESYLGRSLGVPKILTNVNSSKELIDKITTNKNTNLTKLKDDLTKIERNFNSKNINNNAKNILQKMLNFVNSVGSLNINVDNILVLENGIEFRILNINGDQIEGYNVDEFGNQISLPYTLDNLDNVKKLEPLCAPVNWKLI